MKSLILKKICIVLIHLVFNGFIQYITFNMFFWSLYMDDAESIIVYSCISLGCIILDYILARVIARDTFNKKQKKLFHLPDLIIAIPAWIIILKEIIIIISHYNQLSLYILLSVIAIECLLVGDRLLLCCVNGKSVKTNN